MAMPAPEQGTAVEIGDDPVAGIIASPQPRAELGQIGVADDANGRSGPLPGQRGEFVDRQAADQDPEPGLKLGSVDDLFLVRRSARGFGMLARLVGPQKLGLS